MTQGRSARPERTTSVTGRPPGRDAPQGPASRALDVVRGWGAGAAAVIRRVSRTVRAPGWFVLLTATVGLAFGLLLGWVEWIAAGIVAAGLAVASLPFLLDLRSYDVDVDLARTRLTAGEPIRGRVRVRNLAGRTATPGRITLAIGREAIEFAVPLLRGGHESEHVLDLAPRRRGVVDIGPATTVRSDPLGLFRRERVLTGVDVVHIHPRTVPLPSTSAGLIRDLDGNPTSRLVDADISFHAIREYSPGDAQRQIHWKSTAKTGNLMVRQYEETRRSRMALLLGTDASEYASDDEFELAISCATSIALRARRDARDLDIVLAGERTRSSRGPVISLVSARTVLDGFTEVESREDRTRVDELARSAAGGAERLSIAVIVTGSRVGLDRIRRAVLAFPADTAVICVVCDESAHPRSRQEGEFAILTVGVLGDLAGLLMRGASE